MTHQFAISINSDGEPSTGIYRRSNSEFDVNFASPISIQNDQHSQWFVACTDVTYVNSRVNIASSLNNNKFYYNNGDTDKVIVIPEGYYSMETLEDFIRKQIKENGDNLPGDLSPIKFSFDGSRLRTSFEIASGYSITFPSNEDLHYFFGVTAGVTIVGDFTSANQPDVNRGINMFYVICDLVDGNESVRINGSSENMLLNVPIQGPPGAVVTFEPSSLRWQPICRSANNKISKISFRIIDSLFRDFGARTAVQLTLVFKRERVII